MRISQLNLSYAAYRILANGLLVSGFPPFWLYARLSGRHRAGLGQRLGVYPERVRKTGGSPRLWIHAASVGETMAATAVIESLKEKLPESGLFISTTTEHGQAVAAEKLREKACPIYAPLDFTASTRRALSAIRPDILVFLETEIWPNWLMEASRMGIRTALVNGRISRRSIGRYMKIRPLMKEILSRMDAFSMIRPEDADRIGRLGAPRDRIEVNGNAKVDLLARQADPEISRRMACLYGLKDAMPVFVAGSIRGSEGRLVLESFREVRRLLPEALLIIAPRHMARVPEIIGLARGYDFSFQLRTDLDSPASPRTAPLVILDVMGELWDTYSIATVVFCGGSLVPLGGQNILEPASWGKPVLYGPSMEDFLDAKEILEKAGGGIPVRDGADLTEKACFYLTHPGRAGQAGKLAQKALESHHGSARRHAEVILRLLKGKKDRMQNRD